MLHSNWYLLPNTEKRYILLMLSKAQKPTTMKAGTMKLNLDTFVSVCITDSYSCDFRNRLL